MKKSQLILLIISATLISFGAAWAGGVVASKNAPLIEPATEQITKQLAEIYFYRTDGIYKVSSENDQPQQIVKTSYDQEKPYYFTPNFELMGKEQHWLVYKDIIGKRQETDEILFGLMIYDLKAQKEVISIKEEDSSITSFIVSPDKSKLVYVINRRDEAKKVSQGPEPYYQELYSWNGEGKPEKILTEDSGFFGIGLGIWLDNDHITIGKGYEGISYCKIDLTTATSIPTNCDGYGLSSYGVLDNIEAYQDEYLYGYRYEWSEITGKATTKGIFKQANNDQRVYINNDVPSDMVIGSDIYYLRNNLDASKFVYNGVDTDLYMVTKDGSLARRLTNDGNSVMAKSNLNLSLDKRFISYQITDISKITPTENNLQTTQENSGIWVYDTQLNKYYQLAENGLAPKLVVRNIE